LSRAYLFFTPRIPESLKNKGLGIWLKNQNIKALGVLLTEGLKLW
jgi:hypothetical protein